MTRVAEAWISWESMVDMMAAMGAARKTPASQGGSTSIIREGMILSGLSMPGRIARPRAPARCMPSISRALTTVPMRMPLCSALLSR